MAIETIFIWLQEWAEVIAGIGSLLLTGGLVYLYKQQQNLLKRDLNREVRNSHTETLRKRIRAWHGDIEELSVGEEAGFFSDDTNLPKVKGASVQPAPSLVGVTGTDSDFRVIPQAIEDDRYMRDLLENHAPELRESKNAIEQAYQEFEDKRDQFRTEFTDAPTVETEDYTLEPTEYFSLWAFNSAVLLHRHHTNYDKGKLRRIVEESVKNDSSVRPEPPVVAYSADARGSSRVISYAADLKSGDLVKLDEMRDELDEQVLQMYYDTIDDIGDR